ncbi:contact-dependent growth inhibition system immunity protein [Amycolatopsis sp. FBCC-B4732]|uniref:contact-dependent growth inhibition system immunity protein n=1 Tax=Amycolatopsis sp. FBCC-B4732 TaxID=3079339 RepID=UPI001FF4309A|nr:contact-dependent growth inhibition system immunity protein [Amycolatopsis sp. FBCC-B4732]UOX93392.1 contact-dependent growth inhibition system immunity protein [Amycolatopsis sp. FBCC-B4732]
MSLSLEQLEGHTWDAPPADSTRLVRTAHELRRKPVGDLGAEDLRLLLLQHVGIELLVPLALDFLERDPLAEGDCYPGALLVALLKVPPDHWRPRELHRVSRVVENLDAPERVQRQIDAFRAANNP